LIQLFELLFNLQNKYDIQKNILSNLLRENNCLDPVEGVDAARYQFGNSDLFGWMCG
ncbi:hypothetical protein K501DRAFT_194793, partial [Backusella circina FSU 941]